MRRSARSLPIVALLLLGLAGAVWAAGARAQEATPAAGGPAPEAVSFDLVGFAPGVALPSPADLLVVRLGLAPGAVSPVEASVPTGGMLVVEAGAVTVRVEAAWTFTRGAGLAGAMAIGNPAAALEAAAAGEAVTLGAGDVAYVPGSVAGELRNDGAERAVALAFLVGPSEGPTGEAAPAATPGA